jgi:hypothetical protein
MFVGLVAGAAAALALAVPRTRRWWWHLGSGAAGTALLGVTFFRGFTNPIPAFAVDALIVATVVLTYRRQAPSLRPRPAGF